MKNYLKIVAIAFVFFGLLSNNARAQSPMSYKIEKVGAKYGSDFLKETIEMGFLDIYRLNSIPRTVKFDDGSVVRLFSTSDSGKPSNSNLRYDGEASYPNILYISDDKTVSEGMNQAYKIYRQ